jgi:hypothetical protein
MDDSKNDDDEVIEKDGSKLIVDKISLPFLDEAVIDYKESMIKSAFQVNIMIFNLGDWKPKSGIKLFLWKLVFT